MSRPILGYNLVRLTAIAGIALQHSLASSGIPSRYVFQFVDIGQGGVAVFCGLSGLFAGSHADGRVLDWLGRRLGRLFIPYWLCLPPFLLANAISGYKPATIGLIVAQFLGIAGASHAGQLVGTHFWFITLILICYAIAALVRWHHGLLAPWLIAFVLIPLDPGLKGHLLAFLSGMLVGLSSRPRGSAFACLVGWSIALWFDPLYAFPWLGVIAVFAGGLILFPSPRWVSEAADTTYEFYLVHPPILLAVSRSLASSLPVVLVVGSTLSIGVAWILHWASRKCLMALHEHREHRCTARGGANRLLAPHP